ncbi:MAG: DEAD/DEAH box helicase [Planctomycetaceae bacterium]|nr:DEAD/DEAH box helicase [Planctomycetaceae bacterium]
MGELHLSKKNDGTSTKRADTAHQQDFSLQSAAPPSEIVDFASLGLSDEMHRALEGVGFEAPTPIQAAFIPKAITGRDCIGQARTGTGKTAAFVIPVLEQIDHESGELQALVLAPTRELSEQVAAEASRLAAEHNCQPAALVGGRPIGRQIEQLKQKPTIAIGTPGRVLDLIRRRVLDLSKVRIAILDEADRMLDIGFLPDIERILKHCPRQRQTLLLSATMPAPIERLANRFMTDPIRIDLSDENIVTDAVQQFFCTVDNDRKLPFLVQLLRRERPHQAIVFCRTKRGADQLHHQLSKKLPNVAVIHGDLQQRQRDRVMRDFRAGKTRLLIATDVVGRGIDVSSISHIINYNVPEYCDDYVHRVGRTGRMSSVRKGRAFTFATKEEGKQLTSIEMRINLLLDEYTIEGFEAYRPGPKRKHVDDITKPERPEFTYV